MRVREMFDLTLTRGEVGIEIEVEGSYLPDHVDTGRVWKVHTDGSLRGRGYEYVLTKPVARSKVKQVLDELTSLFENIGAKPKLSDRCGVHIHLNFQEQDFNETLNFITLYYMLEDILVKYCGEDREGNLFCLRAKDAEAVIQGLVECAKTKNFSTVQQNYFRYAALNLTALSKFGSLEFRSMRTPRDFADIKTWVDILLRVRDAAADYSSPATIIESMSMDGADAFLRTILGDYTELVQCPDMDTLLMDGARRVQDIVYAKPVKKNTKKKAPTPARRGSINEYVSLMDALRDEPPTVRPLARTRSARTFSLEDQLEQARRNERQLKRSDLRGRGTRSRNSQAQVNGMVMQASEARRILEIELMSRRARED